MKLVVVEADKIRLGDILHLVRALGHEVEGFVHFEAVVSCLERSVDIDVLIIGDEPHDRVVPAAIDKRTAYSSPDNLTAISSLDVEPAISSLDAKPAISSQGQQPVSLVKQLCHKVQALNKKGHHIYSLAMPSMADKAVIETAIDAGIDDFILNPTGPDELAVRLSKAERVLLERGELIEQAHIDSLTGLYNRRAFQEKAVDLILAAEAGNDLSALMIDVDYFKRLNDAFGHGGGDQVLQGIARLFGGRGGLVARMGGDEFAWLLPNVGPQKALEMAETFRRDVNNLILDESFSFPLCSAVPVTLSCSLGLSSFIAGDTLKDLLRRADAGLYLAKAAGRNQTLADSVLAGQVGKQVPCEFQPDQSQIN